MPAELVWRVRGRELHCGPRTLVMGIVNVTPDSFSDGGMLPDTPTAVAHAVSMLADGADILDVGGESTRPGADPVPVDLELDRVIPAIRGILERAPEAVVSVDTRKPAVAAAALEAGAAIVNDVTAAADPETLAVVRDSGAGLILMHMLGDPRTMQDDPRYDDVVREVRDVLADRIGAAVAAGIGRTQLCIDPGIGFGKTLDHNLLLLHDIASFRDLRVPVMAGVSRKRFIGTLTGVEDPAERMEGTAGAVAWCAAAGVDMVRVHDVRAMVRVVRVVDAIAKG